MSTLGTPAAVNNNGKNGIKDDEMSPPLMMTQMFLVHTMTNALFLSPIGGDVRCLFWDKDQCNEDEGWISNWFAFSHFHVAVLLSGLAYTCSGTPKLEATLSYLTAAIIFVYLAEGIFSIQLLNEHLANVQVVIFVLMLIAIAFFTADQERNQPRIPLPRKMNSTSSFDRRQKLSITTIALGVQFLGSMYRVIEMALGGAQNGYKGNSSSPIFQSIANMALCDMMIVSGILGAAIRFFEPDQQKVVLWCHVAALLVSQAMLAGTQGEMIEQDLKEAGGVGTFVSIVGATIGAL